MSSVLDGIPGIIAGALGTTVFRAATLTRKTALPGSDVFDPATGSASVVTYPCRALHDTWSAYYFAGGLVSIGERKLMILAATLATTPLSGDTLTIGKDTLTIVSSGSGQPAVQTDPAESVWVARARA